MLKDKIYNFSAGPAMIPEEVLEEIRNEISNFNGSHQSIMEISHRSEEFYNLLTDTKDRLKKLMNIPENYEVLFIQGGASLQFSMVPMNLLDKYNKAHYIITGVWAKKAFEAASKQGEAVVLSSSEDDNYSYIPEFKEVKGSDYVHICHNNTIFGTRFNIIPEYGEIPLISDISSSILSEPIDISKFGLLYASAQKNAGISGMAIVIIRKDLIKSNKEHIPTMLNYKTYYDNESLYNTPPTFAIYVFNLILKWIESKFEHLDKLKEINNQKANMIYKYLDSSDIFYNNVLWRDRSITNIPFFSYDEECNRDFIYEASMNNIVNIKGHRLVGGMRASIYNAMPLSSVEYLVDFMQDFESRNRGRYL